MIQPGRLPLVGNRYTPFVYSIDVVGVDLTGASILAQIRISPDAAGEPIASFATGLSVTTTNGIPTSTIDLTLTEASMTAMPEAAEIGNAVALAWDMVVTTADTTKFVLVGGSFTINPGVAHG